MTKNKKKNSFTNKLFILAIIALIFGITLSIYYVWVLYVNTQNPSYSTLNSFFEDQLKTNFGDFLSGTVGIVFTITTTLFLFVTFREQRSQFKLSKDDQNQSRFETTFFNLLSMLNDVRNNINQNIQLRLSIKNIYDYYFLFKEYYTNYSTVNNKPVFDDVMNDLNYSSLTSEIEMAEGEMQLVFDKFILEKDCNIGYFFRYIYNVINFVINERKGFNDEHKYLNLLLAQLSNEELSLIFYDAISSNARDKHGNKRFKEILNDYQLLENIDESFLLSRTHSVFYKNTRFKFLTRNELSQLLTKDCNQ